MGQTSGSGYDKLPVGVAGLEGILQKILGQGAQSTQLGAQGLAQFLGPEGGRAIAEQANQNFRQQTLPAILNAFGSGNKGSSALNQALAAGAANLNTNLAAQLSQNQLTAAQGLGSQGIAQQQLGATQSPYAYQPKAQPIWAQWVGPAIQAAGTIGGAALGGPVGAAAGGAIAKGLTSGYSSSKSFPGIQFNADRY